MRLQSQSVEPALAHAVGFELLGEALGRDVESALTYALADGAVFPGGAHAIAIFRTVLADSIREIETYERGQLFQRLTKTRGPLKPLCHKQVTPLDLP